MDKAHGVVTLAMGDVRDAYGAGRLGVHVRTNISKKLRSLGLASLPSRELPSEQEAHVRVYRQGGAIADLIDAVLNPSTTHDDELRAAVGGDAQVILDAIKELVE